MENAGTVLMPGGGRDLLPGEARPKRDLEDKLLRLFEAWGYSQVATPTFEFYETLAPALGELEKEQLFRFLDERGRLLVLRPDMTTPIARLVSTRLKGASLPLRLCYVANIFRRENHTGRQQEFCQAGVELIGASSPAADAEILGLAGTALAAAGVASFRLTVGHTAVLEGMLAEAGFSEDARAAARLALSRKDLVAWEELVASCCGPGKKREFLLSLAYQAGGVEFIAGVEELFTSAEVRAGTAHLRAVWELLEAYGLGEQVSFDLSLLRGLRYYTGIVFEGYAPGVGYPLCGGGRYDGLLAKFGFQAPATGFALVVERLLEATSRPQPAPEVPDYFVAGRDAREVVRRARDLRARGFRVEVEVAGRSPEEAVASAAARGIPRILVLE